MSKHFIVGGKGYNFKDEKTNKWLQGGKIWYLEDYDEDAELAVGKQVLQCSVSYEIFETLMEHKEEGHKVPGHFDIDFRQKRNKDGSPTLVVTAINPVFGQQQQPAA